MKKKNENGRIEINDKEKEQNKTNAKTKKRQNTAEEKIKKMQEEKGKEHERCKNNKKRNE